MEMNNLRIDYTKPYLINELTHGRGVAKQLQVHLEGSSSSTAKLLTTKILSTFDKVLFMMNWEKSAGEVNSNNQPADQLITGSTTAMVVSMSPHSVSKGSPQSYYSSDFIGVTSSRRKKLPRWTEKVHVGMLTGFEAPPDDGYDWRKYGQKVILGATHPRSYYRCTHRKVQGCQAIKQVQRSDEDPSIFNITYEGNHTCTQQSDVTLLGQYYSANNQHHPEGNEDQMERKKRKISQAIIFDFQKGSEEVKTKEFDTKEFTTASSFTLPSKSPITYCLENENNNIFSSLASENNFMASSSFSSPFDSPGTSESNFFSTSSEPILDLAALSLDPLEFQSNFLGYPLLL